MADKIPFHLIDDATWEHCKLEGLTWRDIDARYHQPTWCNYPDALSGVMGCWSLVGRLVTGEDYCKSCDEYKGKQL